MTSTIIQNLNITLSVSSHFLYKVAEHKSLDDVDNWKTVPGRHAQFSVRKMNRSGQVRGGKRARGRSDCAKLFLPGYMVQLIYL